jgi:SAM-dependent methyltransferase
MCSGYGDRIMRGDDDMQRIVNVEQAEAWNGPEGEHWAAHATHAPADIDRDLLNAVAIGATDRVLDIGCGIGQTTRAAARRAHAGRALGLDLSAPQLARARELTAEEGLANVTFEQGDAQVHPLPAAGFDVVVSRFGVMFFGDPVAAFGNVARSLAPGGRLAFVCPQAADDQEWFVVPLAGLLGDAPEEQAEPAQPTVDDSGPGMFSLADRERIVAVLSAAGFTQIELTPLARPMDFGPDVGTAVDFYMGSGPVRALLATRPDLAAPARANLDAILVRYLTPAGVRIPATNWLVAAVRP